MSFRYREEHALEDEVSMSVCAVVWCDNAAKARGLCKRCYARWRKCLPPTKPRHYASNEDKTRLRQDVTEQRKAGESIGDIAAAVGMNTSTLSRWFREWGVKPEAGRDRIRPGNLWHPWSRRDIEFALSRADLTVAERATVLKRTVSSIDEVIRKHGHQ